MINRHLTTRQKDVLEFLRGYRSMYGRMPTLAEVNEFLGNSIPVDYNGGEPVTSAAAHLKQLATKGYLVEAIKYGLVSAPAPVHNDAGMVVCLPCSRCRWSDEIEDTEHRCERQSGGYTHDESKVDLYIAVVLPAGWGCPAGEEREESEGDPCQAPSLPS